MRKIGKKFFSFAEIIIQIFLNICECFYNFFKLKGLFDIIVDFKPLITQNCI